MDADTKGKAAPDGVPVTGVREIPKLPGEIVRIRYRAYVDDEMGIIDGNYEALQDPEGEYQDPPIIPEEGIAIIFPNEETELPDGFFRVESKGDGGSS